ncbi:PilZ domain-containing protein [Candidatus Omnitrophota bacterium]
MNDHDNVEQRLNEKREIIRPSGSQERRRYIRSDTAVPLTLFLSNAAVTEGIQTVTKNISSTGIMVEVDEQLPLGAEAKLELNTPGGSNPVHCSGKIVWSNRLGETDKFHSGIEFVKIEEDNKNTFLKFLCDIIYNTGSATS